MLRSKGPSANDHSVTLCKQAIFDIDAAIKGNIDFIHSCNGPPKSLNTLSRSVKDGLKKMGLKIDELEIMTRVMRDSEEKTQLVSDVEQFRQSQLLNRNTFRAAVASCMQRIEATSRHDLFAKSDGNLANAGGSMFERNFAKQTVSSTEGLSELLSRMGEQVKQSEDTLTTLIQSSQTVGETEGEYRSTQSHIQSSGKLLSKYGRREFTDKILFFLALALYFGTVLYIVKKRLFGISSTPASGPSVCSEPSVSSESPGGAVRSDL